MRPRRSGTEPTTARSAYGLRRVLAVLALVVGSVGAIVAAIAANQSPGGGLGYALVAGILLIVALTAAVDVVVLLRRRRRARHPTATT